MVMGTKTFDGDVNEREIERWGGSVCEGDGGVNEIEREKEREKERERGERKRERGVGWGWGVFLTPCMIGQVGGE